MADVTSRPVVSAVCVEDGVSIRREVRWTPLSYEKLNYLWEKLSKFPTLFNSEIKTVDDFINSLIDYSGGEVKARGLVWEVDDVGIFYLTDIYPGYQAAGHFTFWDGRFNGREGLIKEMIRYVFEEYQFHRIVAEVPLYSRPALRAAERTGFVKEGRLRKATWYKGEWWDVNLYSILEEEGLKNGLSQAGSQQPSAEVASHSAR